MNFDWRHPTKTSVRRVIEHDIDIDEKVMIKYARENNLDGAKLMLNRIGGSLDCLLALSLINYDERDSRTDIYIKELYSTLYNRQM